MYLFVSLKLLNQYLESEQELDSGAGGSLPVWKFYPFRYWPTTTKPNHCLWGRSMAGTEHCTAPRVALIFGEVPKRTVTILTLCSSEPIVAWRNRGIPTAEDFPFSFLFLIVALHAPSVRASLILVLISCIAGCWLICSSRYHLMLLMAFNPCDVQCYLFLIYKSTWFAPGRSSPVFSCCRAFSMTTCFYRGMTCTEGLVPPQNFSFSGLSRVTSQPALSLSSVCNSKVF